MQDWRKVIIPWRKITGCERPTNCFWPHQGGISLSQVHWSLQPTSKSKQGMPEDWAKAGHSAANLWCTRQTQFLSLCFHSDCNSPAWAHRHPESVRLVTQLSIIHATSGHTWGLSSCHVLLTHYQISSTPTCWNSSFTSWPADDSWILTTPRFYMIVPSYKKLDLQSKTSVATKPSGMGQILLGRHFEFRGGIFLCGNCMGKMTKQNVSTRLQGFSGA